MRHQFHRAARAELRAQAAHYRAIRKELGKQFLDQAERAVANMKNLPRKHPRLVLPSPFQDREIRWLRLKQFPFMLVFEVRASVLAIVAVSHIRRQPLYWLDRLANQF